MHDDGETHPKAVPIADEVVIEKKHPDAFQDSDLQRVLSAAEIEFSAGD